MTRKVINHYNIEFNCSVVVQVMYKSLVFGDEFLAQGLHLQSHQRC